MSEEKASREEIIEIDKRILRKLRDRAEVHLTALPSMANEILEYIEELEANQVPSNFDTTVLNYPIQVVEGLIETFDGFLDASLVRDIELLKEVLEDIRDGK